MAKTVLVCALHGVPDGVSKAEGLAKPALAFVIRNNISFDFDTTRDHSLEPLVIIARFGKRSFFERDEKTGVAHHAVFDNFAAAVGK